LNLSDDRLAYLYFAPLSTRWSDNDIYGHVNNVTYYSYFDTVCNQYLIERGNLDIQSADVVGFVVSSSCDYFLPIEHPASIDVGLRVNQLGRKSVQYGLGIFLDGEQRARAVGAFTHVFVNRSSGKSVEIPSLIRGALETILVDSKN